MGSAVMRFGTNHVVSHAKAVHFSNIIEKNQTTQPTTNFLSDMSVRKMKLVKITQETIP
jgi:hypothetical protein